MLRETAKKYYLEQNYNCAESVLRAANEEYGLGLDEGALKLMAGFGGGMGCGGVCGALSGGIAALSKLRVSDRAHTTPGFSGECAGVVAAFEEKAGSCQCSELKARFFREGTRCLDTVEIGCQALEEYLGKKE